MSTWELTPNVPNQLTHLANPFIGWQLTLATAMDVLTGMMTVYAAGWVPNLKILATSAPNFPIFQLILTKGKNQVVINDTDWMAFDGQNVWQLSQADVTANYTVAQYIPQGS